MLTLFILAGLFVVGRKSASPAPSTEGTPPFIDDAEPVQRMESRRYVVQLASGDRTEEAFTTLFADRGVNGKFVNAYNDGLVLIELWDINIPAAFERLASSPLVAWIDRAETFVDAELTTTPQPALTAALVPESLPHLRMPGTTMGG